MTRKRSNQGTRRLRAHAASPYAKLDELFASPTEPLSADRQRHQLTRFHQALAELETAEKPSAEAWRLVSDAVNLTETIIVQGYAEDASGLLPDAVRALAQAGARHVDKGQTIRLSGPGLQAVRAVIASYTELIAALPARTMVRVHRETQQRMAAILRGVKQPHDVLLVEVP